MKHAIRLFALLMVLGAGSSASTAAAPSMPPVDAPPTLEAMEQLRPLRLADPPRFITAVQALEAAPTPPDPIARETLQLLVAYSRVLQARYDEADRLATPIADRGRTPALRVRASTLIVSMMATRRKFVEGQRRLEPLLANAEAIADAGLQRHVGLMAAIFYNQLSQPELAQRHAEAVLAAGPDVVERCAAQLQVLEARVQMPVPRLDDDRFAEAAATCDAAGGGLLRGFVDVAHARWLVAGNRALEAAALLRARMPAIAATRYPILQGDAHARLADALQRSGALDEAEREAEAALALGATLPTGLPRLMARRTLYAVALERGDTERALRELQAVMAAERTYSNEIRHLQEAYESGRGATIDRQQALALLEQRKSELTLEHERAKRHAAVFEMLLVPVILGLLATMAWVIRARILQRRLQQAIQFDPLTGLWTRAHFTAQATAALARAEARAQPMALLLIDLDHFSRINARFGHLSGDRLLAAVGATLRGLEGDGGRFGRLGGEEFAVLLQGAGLDEGLTFAERCRTLLAETSAPAIDESTRMSITASFGVASTSTAGYRLRDLLTHADHALYRAKNAGRNRVAAATVVPISASSA